MPPQVQEQAKGQQQPVKVDPYSDPVAYLKAHRRKPLGNPEWPNCLWIDENKPMFAQEEMVEKKAAFIRPDPKDPKRGIVEMRQVKQRSANAAGHVEENPVFQVRHTPAQTPMFMQEALLQCMEEDGRKLMEAQRKASAAA